MQFSGVGSSESEAITQRGQRLSRRGQRRLKEQNEVFQTTPASSPETSTTQSYSLVLTAANRPQIVRNIYDPGERLRKTHRAPSCPIGPSAGPIGQAEGTAGNRADGK